jgi:hypothetical protein
VKSPQENATPNLFTTISQFMYAPLVSEGRTKEPPFPLENVAGMGGMFWTCADERAVPKLAIL